MNEISLSWIEIDAATLSPIMRGVPTGSRVSKGKITSKGDLAMMASPESFVEALRAIAVSSDRRAYAALFSYFAPRVKTYLVKLGAARSQAEDIAQETMLTVWRKAALYDPSKASPAAWVFTIARNLRIDALRKERHPSMSDLQSDTEESAEPLADFMIDQAQQGDLLLKALRTLPKEQEEVIRLAYFSDKPHSEIERELRIPLGTVKSRLRLATARLKKIMEDYR